jgi:predicted Fe-Mo cluster-binding NifX family protein
MFVNPVTLDFEAIPNPAHDVVGGAGILAVQLVLDHGADAGFARRLGPNAFRVINAAGIPTYVLEGATVRETLRAYQAQRLRRL